MTLRKNIALFAAGVAVIGAGTLTGTAKPAAAAPMMPSPAISSGHYNWSLSDLFGGSHQNRDDRQRRDDRDQQSRDNRDWQYRDHGRDYGNRNNSDYRDNGNRGDNRDSGYRNDGRSHDEGYGGHNGGYRNDGGSRDGSNRDWRERGGDNNRD